MARQIPDEWYRCQALAAVAEHIAAAGQRRAIIDEALASAHGQKEPNRVPA
jgi:hypothetical protein